MKLTAKLQNNSKEELVRELAILQGEKIKLQKELSQCKHNLQLIYKISSLMENNDKTLCEILQSVVNVIPSGWQYSENVCARITLDGREYETANFKTTKWRQSEKIFAGNVANGLIEVFYLQEKPDEFVGPFLNEECNMLKMIAERLGNIALQKLLKEEFTVVFEESPVAKCIIELNNNFRFLDVNEVFLSLTGYTRKEIIGNRPTKIGLFKDIQVVDKMLGDINQQGYIKDLEYEYVTKGGQVKSTILNTKVIHINGRKLAVASFIDLTEIKKTQDELKETEARYRSLVQSQTDVISRSNFEGDITFANNSYYMTFGLSRKDIKKVNFLTTVYPEDIPAVHKALGSLKQPPYRKYLEIRNITAKGVRWFGWENMAVVDENGKICEFQGVGRDITDRIINEEKIHESEKQFQLIAKNVSDVIWMYNLTQNKYTYISPSIEKLRGFTANEVIKQTLIESISEKDMDKLMQLINENVNRFAKDNIPRTLVNDFQLKCKDGGLVWTEISSYLQKNSSGEIEIFGVSRNIDKRKKAELKALEHQVQLNSALKIAELGYYIVFGTNASIDFIDEQSKSILGFNEDSRIASLESWLHNVHADYRDNLETLQKELYNSEKETMALVYKYHHPDKGLIWIKHNAEVLQKNENLQALKVFGVLQDITELKQKEEELIKAKQMAEDNETQLKASQAMAKLGSWELDIDAGMFTFTDNFYKIFKTNAEEVGGYQMSVNEYADRFIHPDDHYLLEEIAKKAAETRALDFEMYFEHKINYSDGGIGYVGVRIYIKKDENGKTIKCLGVNQDITERKIIEQELTKSKEKAEESDRLKSAFLMNVSHEIRTPMNGILGFIDLMNEPDLDEEERRSFIDVVNKSGERLLNTINDIVEISKIEIGDIKLIHEDVNTEDIMHYHLNFFRLQAEGKSIELKISRLIKGKDAFIKTDKQKLDGILMNLIRNAIKFTSNGTIEFGNYIEGDRIYFYVSDSGRGIPDDKQEAIFDRFVQVQLGNTRGYEGSGIGLSIVKAYIEALNGDIVVKSELGKGSTFLFSLPYSPVNSKFENMEKTEIDSINSSKQTVLIAEDDEVNYYFLENILSKEFKLMHAESGEEALQLFKDNPEISIVLMDIKMPGEYDGLDTTRKIREMDQHIPIIAQTAYAMESDKIKALEAGCNDYISKPYSPVGLNKLIRKYCNKETGVE